MQGPAVGEFQRAAFRFSLVIRTVVCLCAGVLAPFAAGFTVETITAAVVVNAWNLVLWRARGRWLLPADLTLMVALCLVQRYVEPIAAPSDGTSWVLVVVSVVSVSWQWRTRLVAGGVAVLVLAYAGGAALAADWDTGVPYGLWLFVEAALSRLLYVLVRRAARAADEAADAAELADREAEVAAARQREHREYLATLHDTGAATLMMVGAGVADGPAPWLSAQAARDVAALAERPRPDGEPVPLAPLLVREAESAPVSVDVRVDHQPVLPPEVATALARGVGEALRNVHRHAGTGRAQLSLTGAAGHVVVEVRDEGRGFVVEEVSGQRRGVANSVLARMDRVGGRGEVESVPGTGTTVRLEWPG